MLVLSCLVLSSPPARGRGLKHLSVISLLTYRMSPPARGRGLKHCAFYLESQSWIVAPRTGAWIETFLKTIKNITARSPPARGRGLKPEESVRCYERKESPPARGRGLKLTDTDGNTVATRPVAPRTGAWIETNLIILQYKNILSPPARGRGLKLR